MILVNDGFDSTYACCDFYRALRLYDVSIRFDQTEYIVDYYYFS